MCSLIHICVPVIQGKESNMTCTDRMKSNLEIWWRDVRDCEIVRSWEKLRYTFGLPTLMDNPVFEGVICSVYVKHYGDIAEK